MKKTIKQVITEFGIPFILALFWAGYSIYSLDGAFKISDFINTFGPAFFLISWAFAQVFRINKQNRIESSFGRLEAKTEEIIGRLERHSERIIEGLDSATRNLIGNISGGKSILYLKPLPDGKSLIFHSGEYAVFDVAARAVDLERFLSDLPRSEYEYYFHIKSLLPGYVDYGPNFKLMGRNVFNLNIFYTARNGSYTQFVRMKKIDAVWTFATKVFFEDSDIVFVEIDDNYPKCSDGNIDWDS